MSRSTPVEYQVTSVVAPTASFVQLSPQHLARTSIKVQNKGDDTIFLYYGDGTPTEDDSMQIGPGDFFEPFVAPSNAIYVKTISTATADSRVWMAQDALTSTVNNS